MSVTRRTLRLATELRVYLDGIIDAQTRALVAAWARAWDEVVPHVEAAVDAVLAADPPVRADVLARSERAVKAMHVIADQLTALGELTGVTVTGDLAGVVGTYARAQAALVASQLPTPAGSDFVSWAARFDRVDPAAIRAIVARSAEQITARTLPLSANAMEAVRRALVSGIVRGINPRQVARVMLRRTESAFNGGLTRALVISRTEMLDASRAAAMAGQEADADVLAGWQWQSTLDVRTCPSCWSQHGSVHALDEPGPIDHQQGRCSRLPKTRTWRELGIDVDEPDDLLPDAQAVFRQLSEVDQVRVMGRARLAALDSGEIRWSDLSTRRATPEWRDSYVVRPLQDLLPA